MGKEITRQNRCADGKAVEERRMRQLRKDENKKRLRQCSRDFASHAYERVGSSGETPAEITAGGEAETRLRKESFRSRGANREKERQHDITKASMTERNKHIRRTQRKERWKANKEYRRALFESEKATSKSLPRTWARACMIAWSAAALRSHLAWGNPRTDWEKVINA